MKPNTNGVKARLLARGLDVLFALSRSPGGAKLGELGEESRLPNATVLRILRTMMDRDVVKFDPRTKVYRLGPALLQLGSMALRSNNIVHYGQPILDSLRERSGETACLFERHGMERICIASSVSNHDLGLRIEPGQVRPLMDGNAGRVLVAFLESEECAPFMIGKSAAERAAMKREFASLRKVGYTITQNEIVAGATAIASPVFDATRRVVASLAILGPTARVSKDQAFKYAPWVRQAAEQLSMQLGRDAAGYMT